MTTVCSVIHLTLTWLQRHELDIQYIVYGAPIHLTHFSIGEIWAVCPVNSLFSPYTAAVYVCHSPEQINSLNYNLCLQLLKFLLPYQPLYILHHTFFFDDICYLNAHCVHCYYMAVVVTTSADDSNRCSYHCLNSLSTECQWADSDSVLVLMFDGGWFQSTLLTVAAENEA